jgi:cell division septal protein FtsQ
MDAARNLAGDARLGFQTFAEEAAPPTRPLALAVALSIAVLLAVLIYIPFASPRFAVRSVEVRGDENVARAAAASIHLPANTNMLRAPLRLIEQQAEGCAAVREARASRALPDRIVVAVERREAVAVIRRGDAAFLVDPNGVPFTVAGEGGWGLPELGAPHLAAGPLTSEAARAEIRDSLAVLRALGPDPRLQVTRLQLGRDGGIELILDSGTAVYLGQPKNLGVKARLLVAVIEQIGIDRIKRLDLSLPPSAWWEPREGGRRASVR